LGRGEEMERGKEKLIADIGANVKDQLKELAYKNKTHMTGMIVKLIKAEYEKTFKK
jgi:hypothetical protein